MMGSTVSVAFLGIDGSGKSSLAHSLASALADKGVTVSFSGWRPSLEGMSGWRGDSVRELWVETFRLLVGATPLSAQEIPDNYRDWVVGDWEGRLNAAAGARGSSVGALAAAFVEIAGAVLQREPVTDDTRVRIVDSFPYKYSIKDLIIARSLGEVPPNLLESTRQAVRLVYETPWMQPDIGFMIRVKPETALARLQQRGPLNIVEDLRLAGQPGVPGFHAMQRACADEFEHAASAWNWNPFDNEDNFESTRLDFLELALPLVERALGDKEDSCAIS